MSNKDFNLQRHHATDQLFRLLDLMGIILSLLIAMWIYNKSFNIQYMFAASVAMLTYLLLSGVTNVYHVEPGKALKRRSGLIILTCFLTFVILLLVAYMTKTSTYYSRVVISLWFILMPIMLISLRLIAYKLRLNRYKDHRKLKTVAVLGANEVGNDIALAIKNDLSLGYHFTGFFDDRTESEKRTIVDHNYPVLGTFEDVVKTARARQIDILYITLPLAAEKRIIKLLEELSDTAITVHIIPNFFIYNILHARWHSIGSHQALSIYDKPFYGAGSLVKKLEDMSIGSLIMLLICLPMIVIAIAIKLTSPGPVIFKQKRYGINGKELTVYKFRSMTTCDDGNKIKQAEKNDARITKLGAFLRKTSLDELPQFFNVLDGSMSIVGPRPHAIAHNEEYRKKIGSYMLRHMVKPGITGWAQINGYRGETRELEQMEKRIECDLYYIRNWSLIWDIKIIFLTIFKGFVNKNAY